jgi:hypothetical protein
MLDRSLWHKSLTDEVLIECMERRMSSPDDPGFCFDVRLRGLRRESLMYASAAVRIRSTASRN